VSKCDLAVGGSDYSKVPIREMPAADKRVESGPVQFGNDWPGTFIRGDDAAHYAMSLDRIINGGPERAVFFDKCTLVGLLHLLNQSNLMMRRAPDTSTDATP
jgi:hypothetical protein